MNKILTTAALALALLPATTAPAAAQNREHVQMAAELRMLQEQQAQLALAMNQLAQALNEAVKTLNSRTDQTNSTLTKGFADQALALRSLADDLRAVRANSQDTSVRLGNLKEEIEALRSSVTTVLSRSVAAMPPADPLDPNALPPAGGLPPVDAPVTLGMSVEQTFNTALSDYAAGQFSLAIAGFAQFIRTFPTSERVDDAYFYMGDAEYAQNRFEEAIAAYNQAIQLNGDQVPNAYYKRGLALDRLRRTDEARASFEMAIKTAPNPESNVAVMAKQNLDRLSQQAPARP